MESHLVKQFLKHPKRSEKIQRRFDKIVFDFSDLIDQQFSLRHKDNSFNNGNNDEEM